MPTYAELNALAAEAYLDANNFWSDFERMHGRECCINYESEKYRKGIAVGEGSKEVGICSNGTWYADSKSGGWITSYEGIGYHAGTADFWQGILDSGCRVCVYRDNHKVCIKEARGHWLYDSRGLWGRGSDLAELKARAEAAGIVDYVVFGGEGDIMDQSDFVAIGGNGLHFATN